MAKGFWIFHKLITFTHVQEEDQAQEQGQAFLEGAYYTCNIFTLVRKLRSCTSKLLEISLKISRVVKGMNWEDGSFLREMIQ